MDRSTEQSAPQVNGRHDLGTILPLLRAWCGEVTAGSRSCDPEAASLSCGYWPALDGSTRVQFLRLQQVQTSN